MFASVVNEVEQGPVCGKQDLRSFLVLPTHHIARIPHLLEAAALQECESNCAPNIKQCINAWRRVSVNQSRRIVVLNDHMVFNACCCMC